MERVTQTCWQDRQKVQDPSVIVDVFKFYVRKSTPKRTQNPGGHFRSWERNEESLTEVCVNRLSSNRLRDMLASVSVLTVEIAKRASYQVGEKTVYFEKEMDAAINNRWVSRSVSDFGSTLYRPDDMPQQILNREFSQDKNTIIEVKQSTTLGCCLELDEKNNVCVLNFASAKNPGSSALKLEWLCRWWVP